MNLINLGIVDASSQLKKVKPNPSDVKKVKNIVNILNSKFYRKKNRVFEEVIWYAFLPWKNNDSKTWYFLCSSVALPYELEVKKLEKKFRKSYPNLSFKIESIYGSMYFDAIEHRGTYM